MKWEVVIGLETHAQLSTRSKIFSGSSTAFGASPNSQASAVDIALPGVLPVLNRGAVERAIRFGLAVGGTISRRSIFARKNYFYPDLPKGYQISQYELPIVVGGTLDIVVGDTPKTVRLTRAHLEEDAGKSLHEDFHGMSGIDLNRAGTPLLEIVTEPDMRSAEEAVAYAKKLHGLVQWIGICDGNMQEGSFRCDANVSVRPAGSDKLGTRCEIKNMNSFRFMEQAIKFEVRRQIEIIEDGGTITQETRLYDPDRDETRSMRSKEDAMDYRYFPDPDLLPLEVTEVYVEEVRRGMSPPPSSFIERFRRQQALQDMQADGDLDASMEVTLRKTLRKIKLRVGYGLSNESAIAMADTLDAAEYFVECVEEGAEAAQAANWITGAIAAKLNEIGKSIDASPVSATHLAGLLRRIQDGTISGKIAKEVFAQMWAYCEKPEMRAVNNLADITIKELDLQQISDSGEIEKIVDQVLAANAQQVADYKSGKEKAFNSLVGQVMKASKGKANPAQVNALLKQKLAGG